MDIHAFLITNPNVIWILVVIGSVAVIGLVDFCKNWFHKKAVQWVVLCVSLGVAVVLSPITPPLVATILILWLLILAVSTIARNAVIDGLPHLVSGFLKFMGTIRLETEKQEEVRK
jgi:hypothetical protein